MIEIKDKSGNVILAQNTLTYTGNFMGERSVSCSVQSPTVLPFSNRCYVDYRGERFTLDKTPSPTIKKISSENSVGNAFQYELKFISLHFELQNVAFRDLVLNDSTNYYSGTTDVEFTGTVDYLLNRIQACLDEVYFGDKKWNIELEDGVLTSTENIKATNISCFDALSLVNSTENWKLNYEVAGRNIKVGYSVDRINKSFEYGKGNGLYELSRNVVESESIVTRLRAYGASTNISSDYKRETGVTGRVCPDSQYVTKLMLPSYACIDGQFVHSNSKGTWNNSTAYSKGDLVLYSNNIRYYCIQNSYSGVLPTNPLYFSKWPDDFIDSPNISKYGIREGVFTDESIFPTISGITIRELELSGSIDSKTGSSDRVDEILASSKVPVDIKNAANNQSYFYVWIRNIGFDISKSILSASSPTLELVDTPTGLGGFSFEITSVKEDTTSYVGSKYRLTLKRNTTESFTIPNSDSNIYLTDDGINFIPNGIYAHFVLTGIELPFIYVKTSENRLLESAQNYLTKHDSPLSTYSLNVDEIEMARNRNDIHQSIHEGQSIGIFDENIECGSRISSNSAYITSEHPRWNDSESDIIFGIDLFSMNIVPSGSRYASFSGIGKNAFVWTSDMYDADNAVAKKISFDNSEFSNTFLNKHTGASVIAVRYANDGELNLDDGTVRSSVYTDVDGNVYDGVKIGDKVWLNKFIKTTKYSKETGTDSIIFNGSKYLYKGAYSGSNTYVINDCVIDGGSYFRKANDGFYSPRNVPYGQNPTWYELPNYPQTYQGEYNSSIGYQIGAIVLRNGLKYFKSKLMPTSTDPADITNPNHVGWVVFVSNPYVVIDRLISGLSDSNWVSANYGAVCSYPYPVENLSSESQIVNSYGRLYNHYAVENTLGLISDENGFRIPSLSDFSSLENYIKSKFPSESSFGIGNALKSKFQVNSPFDSSFKEVRIHQYIPIQTLTIKEGFGAIPTYDITLSTSPVASTLNAISNSVKSNSVSIANNSSKITSVSNSISKSIVEVKSSLPTTPADTGSEPAILPKQNGILSWLNSSWVFLEDVFVRNTRKINGKTLADDITLTTLDISETPNKRYQSDLQSSVNDATSSIQTQIDGKQQKIQYPTNPTGDTFLNDLGTFSAPPTSGGGSASGTPVYFWPTNSPTSGYLELDYTPYSSVVENTYSIPVGTTLLSSHLTDLQIATTTIDAGNWYISSRSKVNNLSGSTKLHVDFFLYHLDGTRTVLFGGDSETFSTTDYKVYQGQLPEASFTCATTDRLGVSIYAINSGGATKTLTISLGQGIATFFSAPLRIRHSNLRDKNGEAAFQHLTSEQVSIVNATSGTNTGDETKTTIQNKLGAASFTNSGYLTSTEWGEFKGKVTFPGFGTTHTTAAYGDHLHTGIYEVPLTFSTGLTRVGNTVTNNITQYTDAMARSAQLTSNSTTTGLLTSADWNTFNNKQPAGSYAPASGSVNYIQNQNTSAQSGNMWIAGDIKGGQLQSTVASGTSPLTVNSTTVVSNLNADLLRGWSPEVFHRHLGYMSSNQDFNTIGIGISENAGNSSTNSPAGAYGTLNTISTDKFYGWQTYMDYTGQLFNRSKQLTVWQPWRKIYDSGNLTNTITINYIPKWNGSSFVNSLISDDANSVIIHGAPSSAAATIFSSGQVQAKQYKLIGQIDGISNTGFSLKDITNGAISWYVDGDNNFTIPSTTQSTSPTTGALVTPGGIGVGGVSHFGDDIVASSTIQASEFVKSGGTSSQFLKANGSVDATNYQPAITLTTNGTSGAATFSGGTLNIPNYSTLNGNFISATVNKTSTRTLTNNDCWVSCENTTTITLPTTASIGKVFYIKGNPYGVGSDVTIECNENFDLIQNLSNYITSYTISSGTAKTIMLVWDGYHWQLTTLN